MVQPHSASAPPSAPASRPSGYDARAVVLAAAASALGGLLLVSWLAGRAGWGAALSVTSAVIAFGAAPAALAAGRSASAVRLGRVVAGTAAALAVLTLAASLTSTEVGTGRVAAPGIGKAPALPPDEEAWSQRPSLPPPVIAPAPTSATAVLNGRVTYVDGTPLQGAVITATRAQRGDTSSTPACPLERRTTTDARGMFTMKLCQLAPGLGWTLRAERGKAAVQTTRFLYAGRPMTWEVRLPLEPPRRS